MSINPGRIDKYELQERLGQSSMAEVWKAFDTQAHRYVAVKFLHPNLQVDPDFMIRFQREAQAIVSLRHPNIVQYYGFSISQPPGRGGAIAPYMVMNYVEGGTLADYIRNTSRKGQFLPIADIVRLFTPIGMAVDYAHQHNVVHGNIKPENILLDKHNTSTNAMGEPIVTDFGMARLLGVTAGSTSGWQISTPRYISPEQVMGAVGDGRSDIYALGIILYEICTGTPPFQGNSPAAIMMQHVNTLPASPALINPNLPPAFTQVIMHSIAKDPSARFPTASSLVAALAHASEQGKKEGSNRVTPEWVRQPAYPVNAMDMPTVLSTGQSPLPAGMTPSTSISSSPGISDSSFPSPAVISGSGRQTPASYSATPFQGVVEPAPFAQSEMDMPTVRSSQPYPVVGRGAGLAPPTGPRPGPATPMPPLFTPGQSVPNLPVVVSPPPTAPSPEKRRRRGVLIALVALVLLALVGSSLAAYFAVFSQKTPPPAPMIAGHAYFVSSGLLSQDSNQGITDLLQIGLSNISAPESGKSYYAWLLNDKSLEFRSIPLGPLTVNHGIANLSYPGDAVHSNLLATNSRFLITEEDTNAVPSNPSLDPGTWRYYAEFSQKPNPADPSHYSVYDHIRHLLSDDPKVKAAGLTGGLDIWLYRNTQKILEWAGSSRDFWKNKNSGGSAFIHRQLTRILDYLDGTSYVQKDLPGQDLLVNATIAKVPLLTFDPQTQNPPGYLYHIGKHLHELTLLPATTPEQKKLAIQINQSIGRVNLWLQTIRTEILELYHMTDAQLFGNEGLTLLDSIATLANTAFVGQINPHAQVTDGVVQIHYNIQRLATFDIRACAASDPCAL